MSENKRSSVSYATSLEEVGAFWDTHDFTEHDTNQPDILFTVRRTIAIEAQLFEAIKQEAHSRGVTVETLVNVWLQQKMSDESTKRAA
jgi:hypothetical protein